MIVQKQNASSSPWYYVGTEYGYTETIYDNAILVISVDRGTVYDKGWFVDGFPHMVSYPAQGTGEGEEQRLGTKNEVLFDVITITPDNRIVCTRIGAGDDITYNLPTQS